jgi:hypothetical protein
MISPSTDIACGMCRRSIGVGIARTDFYGIAAEKDRNSSKFSANPAGKGKEIQGKPANKKTKSLAKNIFIIS